MVEITAANPTQKPGKVRRIGVYAKVTTLARLDGRTREARLIRTARAELVRHVGGTPSATQRCIIDRCAVLAMQIAKLDEKHAAGSGLTPHDQREYLAWTNTYTRLLRQLGMKGAADRGPTLAEHLARQSAA